MFRFACVCFLQHRFTASATGVLLRTARVWTGDSAHTPTTCGSPHILHSYTNTTYQLTLFSPSLYIYHPMILVTVDTVKYQPEVIQQSLSSRFYWFQGNQVNTVSSIYCSERGVQCFWNELSPEPGDINTLWHNDSASQETSQSVRPVSKPSWQQTRQVGQSGSQTSRIQDAGWSVSASVSQIKKKKQQLGE